MNDYEKLRLARFYEEEKLKEAAYWEKQKIERLKNDTYKPKPELISDGVACALAVGLLLGYCFLIFV